MRFVPTLVHGIADYAVGLGMIMLAFISGAEGAAFALFILLGTFAILYALATDYELGWKPYLTMPAHLVLDGVFAMAMLGLPLVLPMPMLLVWSSLAIGVMALFLVVTTRFR